MKVSTPKKWKVNGKIRWVWDGVINGKRKREQFGSEKACKAFIRSLGKDEEESFVRRLATGICTVWNQNPKAFKWWSELV